MNILGVSAFYHDSAAALVRDGDIVAAAQEERFTRKRHDARYPSHAIAYCLAEAKIDARAVDYVVFYDKPWLKFERLVDTYLSVAPRGFRSFAAAFASVRDRPPIKKWLESSFPTAEILFSEHHQSHAASAFYPSPFEEAVVLTMDGVGEWTTTSAAIGRGNRLDIFKEIHFPHSLGLLYSAFTYYCGFKVNSGEYKLMGLAPYGQPRYAQKILDHLIDLKPDGSFRMNMQYFHYCEGLTMTAEKFAQLFGGPARQPDEPLTQRHKDLAASIQSVLELCVVRLTRSLVQETGLSNLCLAGGVALNCVANGAILRDGHVKNLWVQPAAGDAGGALGAALAAYYRQTDASRTPQHSDGMKGALLGPAYSQSEIETRLRKLGARFVTVCEDELVVQCANAIAQQKAVGWFQGRMEFGPRALGARSILADPRSSSMQSVLNLKVKKRESFRPFAPSITRDAAHRYFDLDVESPYMLLTAQARGGLPATTHLDGSARVQTVNKEWHPRYHALLTAFEVQTGCPVVVNTSFNVRGEPIVCTPEDAFRCFMQTDIEVLAIGDCLLRKEEQDASLADTFRQEFEPD